MLNKPQIATGSRWESRTVLPAQRPRAIEYMRENDPLKITVRKSAIQPLSPHLSTNQDVPTDATKRSAPHNPAHEVNFRNRKLTFPVHWLQFDYQVARPPGFLATNVYVSIRPGFRA